ncbi:hypothetical protein [Paraburkholderia youngii]|uniref:hypothetical protein n=1 Tax=Paraburkholderia youngii TaxID=2782701 RepID=UPI003D198E90
MLVVVGYIIAKHAAVIGRARWTRKITLDRSKNRMTINFHSLSRTAIAALVLAGLAACSREGEPPSTDALKHLAAQDSTHYVGKDQCLTEFRWPVTTTVEADGSPTWYVNHDELDALVAAKLAARSIQHVKVDVGAGQSVNQPRLVYELTPKAAPLAQTLDMGGHSITLLCFGKLAWDGNVRPEPVRVEKDSVAGFIFHSSEYDEYAAYRPRGTDVVVSRMSYTLQFAPSPFTKEHEGEWRGFIDHAFRVRKIDVDLSNTPAGAKSPDAGKGWVVDRSHPVDGR